MFGKGTLSFLWIVLFTLTTGLLRSQVQWQGPTQIEPSSTVIGSGDFNADGNVDLAFQTGDFYWYEGPDFAVRHLIGDGDGRCYGATAVDINGDGWTDFIASNGARNEGPGEFWVFLHPGSAAAASAGAWTRFQVYNIDVWHQNDVEVADMDNDGRLDIIIRTRSPKNRVVVALQNADINNWTVRTFSTGETSTTPEGLGIGDIDGDTFNDIVLTGVYWSNAGGWRLGAPNEHIIDPAFVNQAIKADVADVDGDGDNDVAISKAEGSNTAYVALYENTGNPTGGEAAWPKTVLLNNTTNVHVLEFADMDSDGDLDLVAGKSFSERSVSIFYNTGSFETWPSEQFNGGLYVTTIVDLDGDGDLDLAGPTGFRDPVVYYLNQLVENGGGGDPTVPDAPSSLAAFPQSEQSISLNWSDNSFNEAAFLLQRRSGRGSFTEIATINANMTAFVDRGLAASTSYTYRILARNSVGDSHFSEEVSATTLPPDIISPTAPTGLAETAISFNSVTFEWVTATDNVSVTGYRIYRDGNFLAATAGNTFSDTGLDEETSYNYTVEAVDAADNRSTPSVELIILTPTAPDFDGDLIAYWPHDSSLGSMVEDITGSFDGQLAANPATPLWMPADGWLAGALSFDGVDDRADLGTIDVPENLETFSIALWARFDGFGEKEARFISKADDLNSEDHYWMLSTIVNTGLRFRLKTANGGTTTLASGAGLLTVDTWHHIAATYDGAKMRLYLDGEEVGSTNKTGVIARDASVPVALGDQPAGAGERPFHGLLDEVRIYSRALSEEDLNALMQPPVTQSAYEFWQARWFNEAQLNDPEISGFDRDPNQNGLANLVEYAFGRDPLATESEPVVTYTLNEEAELRIELFRLSDRKDITIEVFATNDLSNWDLVARSIGGAGFAHLESGFIDEGDEVEGVIPAKIGDLPSEADAAGRFFQLRISREE